MLEDRDYMREEWTRRFGGTHLHSLSMTAKLILLNLVVFLAQALSANNIVPYLALDADTLRRGYVWTLVTYSFCHGGFMHIFFNLWGLWLFGRRLEHEIGPRHFLYLYLASTIVGGGLWVGANWSAGTVIGASGAVMGVAAAAAFLFPRDPIALLIPPVIVPLRTLVIVYAVIDVLSVYRESATGVAHLAHLGGLVAGLLYVWQLHKQSIRDRAPVGFVELIRGLFTVSPRPARRRRAAATYRKPNLRWAEKEEDDDFTEDEALASIDEILDKIGSKGIHSLTRRERRMLDRARDKLKKDL